MENFNRRILFKKGFLFGILKYTHIHTPTNTNNNNNNNNNYNNKNKLIYGIKI